MDDSPVPGCDGPIFRKDDTLKDERLYAKFTLDFPDHPKILCLSTAAKWALVDLTIYSRRHMTDGFIGEAVALAKHGATVCQELATNDPVNPSLIEVENGYKIHDFDLHQSTKADIEALTEKRKAAGQKGGQAKAVASAKQVLKQKPSKTCPETETYINTSCPNSPSPDTDRIDTKRLTTTLVEALKVRGVKVPGSLKTWDTEARRILDIDKRPLDEALKVLVWSQQDPFWSQNILSMPKFRQKYDQLRLKAADGVIVETRGPDDLLHDCWKSGDPSAIFIATQWTRPPMVWPDDADMGSGFDRTEFRRKFWRTWIENNRAAIIERLRKIA